MPLHLAGLMGTSASMKALPKRKGNPAGAALLFGAVVASMKALPKRKGNMHPRISVRADQAASMKALPKRKGNVPSGGCFVG